MKKLFLLFTLLLPRLMEAQVPTTAVYYQGYNGNGTPQTNMLIFQPYPYSQPYYVVGTNVLGGVAPFGITPGANGFFSNNILPLTYTVQISNSTQVGFFVTIPITNAYIPLSICMTQVPMVSLASSTWAMITNWLGYWPATNTFQGIIGALGFSPATNSFAGIVSALGYVPNSSSLVIASNLVGMINQTNLATNGNIANSGMVLNGASAFEVMTNLLSGVGLTIGGGVISVNSSLATVSSNLWNNLTNGYGQTISNYVQAAASWTNIPIASTSTLGLMQVGSGLSVTSGGVVSATNVGGTVTSVGMQGDGTLFNSIVTGSPVTGYGILYPSLASQSPGMVFASPSGVAGTPYFQYLQDTNVSSGTAVAGQVMTYNSVLGRYCPSNVVSSNGGTVTSVGFAVDSAGVINSWSTTPITGSGITHPAFNSAVQTLSSNNFANGTNAQGGFGSFAPLSATSGTNYTLNFSGAMYQKVTPGGDVCFSLSSGGPGSISVKILPNGANRNILWPTNTCTLNTSGLTLNGTNWMMTLTNGNRAAWFSISCDNTNQNWTNTTAQCACSY